MNRNHILIAALALSSSGAFAAANETSASVTSSSSQSYTASVPNDNSQVSQIQQALNAQGYNVGAVDGQMGPKTKSALKQFQQAKGLQASGKLDPQTVAMLTTNTGSSTPSSTTSNTTSSDTSAPSTTPGMTTGATSPNSPAPPSSSSTPPSSDNPGFSPQTPPAAQGK